MYKTLENFRKLSELYAGPEDLAEKVKLYRSSEDPVILARVFCRYFGAMVTMAKEFNTIPDETKASHAVLELHRALLSYDGSRGAQFLTWFLSCYRNRLLNEMRCANYKKRRANQSAQSLDKSAAIDSTDFFGSVELLETLRRSSEITDKEVRYCEIVLQYRDSMNDTDIAKHLGVSPSAVHQMKRALIKKFRRLELISC